MFFFSPLIPRVRVNYSFFDLLKALLVSERKNHYRILVKNVLGDYFNNKNILLTSSGRSAIYLVLRSLKQKKVVLPAYTCVVVEEAALLAGKEIIYAPTSSVDFNVCDLPKLDSDTILIATHQYGIPCNIEMMQEECIKVGAVLIEDCAGALGTKINGKLVGTFGDFACFSFDSSKLINVPSKGGFILAKNKDLLDNVSVSDLEHSTLRYKVKHLLRGGVYCLVKGKHLYGIFHYITMGRKGRMHISDGGRINLTKGEFYTHGFYEWQASIAYQQLKKIRQIIQRRDYIYSQYDRYIKNPIIQKPPYIVGSSCIRYTIQTVKQKQMYDYCVKHGVDMGFSFNHLSTPVSFSKEHIIAKSILNVPFYYKLKDREMKKVIEVINSFAL